METMHVRTDIGVAGTHIERPNEQLTIGGTVRLYTDLAANVGEGSALRFRFGWTLAS
jgi:hypothetical protein